MTFNIRYDNPDDGNNAWTKRKDKVVSMINFYAPDFFGTQEVLKRQKDYLDQKLVNYNSVGVGREDGKDEGEFSAIYYDKNKFDLIDSGTFWLSETPDKIASVGWDAALERIATWAKLKNGKEEFLFVNTHFDHIGEIARINSANLIIDKIKELSNDVPVILCGDFNFTDETPAYENIIKNKNYKLFDAKIISTIPHHGPSWTFFGFDETMKNKPKIDYIFVSKNVKVKKHAILSDKFDDGYPSDHLPVYCEIFFDK